MSAQIDVTIEDFIGVQVTPAKPFGEKPFGLVGDYLGLNYPPDKRPRGPAVQTEDPDEQAERQRRVIDTGGGPVPKPDVPRPTVIPIAAFSGGEPGDDVALTDTVTTSVLRDNIAKLRDEVGVTDAVKVKIDRATAYQNPILPKNIEVGCRWIPIRNPKKGRYIPKDARAYRVRRFINSCYGETIRIQAPIPYGERAIQQTASHVRSQAHFKRPTTVQHDHRCKCRNSADDNDRCRCSGEHNRTRSNVKTNMAKVRRRPIHAYRRRKNGGYPLL